MPPKKAAKKAAKSADKKNHNPGDARRTFEHLGRVQALSSLTAQESDTLHVLTQAADAAFREQRYAESADLLRAAEHLSFATLHSKATETVAADLEHVIQKEVDHLLARAKEHAGKHEVLKVAAPIMERMVKESQASLQRGAYRSSLELARGAEALAHVRASVKKLAGSSTQKQLHS